MLTQSDSIDAEIYAQTDKVLLASIDDKDPLSLLDVEERQMVKDLEDELFDIKLVFDSLHDTIDGLLRNYNRHWLFSDNSSKQDGERDFDCIYQALHEKSKDVMLNRKKLETLHIKLKGTIKLVRKDVYRLKVKSFANRM